MISSYPQLEKISQLIAKKGQNQSNVFLYSVGLIKMSCAPQNYLMPKTTEQHFPVCQRKKKNMIKKLQTPIIGNSNF